MNFLQRSRLLALTDLLLIEEVVQKEIARRKAFINNVAALPLRSLPLTVKTRDLLYRAILSKQSHVQAVKPGDLLVQHLFTTLTKDDWERIEYLNKRAFTEIRDMLSRQNIPLENYYGEFDTTVGESGKQKAVLTPKQNRQLATSLSNGVI